MNDLVSLLPIIGIVLLFWLLLIRPQAKRQKALAALQGGLEPGNEVMLSAGLFGVIERIEEDRIHLRIAEGVTIEVARGAVNTVVPPATPTTGPTTETTPGE
ncbi:preprotein translocase subunit YajC [Nocardioides sp. GXQ0305]|uniref:preprotein translocase subunit YajC n=1 Tax=Nocardioides sp. GXQ0305 TaxID=3423912 RepID=UPI003D7DA6DD